MSFTARTDLAVETREMIQQKSTKEVEGVEVSTQKLEDITITRVKINNQKGSQAMGKPIGNYVTLDIPYLNQNIKDINDRAINALADEIKNIADMNDSSAVLVVGLGNWNVTPDALGPKVISRIAVTRHLKEYAPEYIDKDARPVCVIAPGVLGITGIETGDVIKGVVEKIKPDLVIAIDALASRKIERVSTTIQLADTGIHPGSGIGNKRMGLNKDTLGVPVLAIGVPTVVDAATMANDTLTFMVDNIIEQSDKDTEFYKILQKMQEGDKYNLIKEILSPYVGDLVVTPKEIDFIISGVSNVVADGINVAMHGTLENAQKYLD